MKHVQLTRRAIPIMLLMLALWSVTPVMAQRVQVDTQHGKVGETVTFTVSLEQAAKKVDALGLTLAYDPEVLRYTGTFTRGPLVQGFDFFDAHERQPGQIRVGGFTTKNPIAQGAGGELLALTFLVRSAGNTTVEIARLVDDLASLTPVPGMFTGETVTIDLLNPSGVPPTPAVGQPLATPQPHEEVMPAPLQLPGQPPAEHSTARPSAQHAPPRRMAGAIPQMQPAQVKSLLEDGADLVIIDVRNAAAFQRAHIRGAVSMPLADVTKRHAELPRQKTIITYCA